MKKPCPSCGKETEIGKNNPYRPFCSERCRLIDLGDWLSEKNSISDETANSLESGDSNPFIQKH